MDHGHIRIIRILESTSSSVRPTARGIACTSMPGAGRLEDVNVGCLVDATQSMAPAAASDGGGECRVHDVLQACQARRADVGAPELAYKLMNARASCGRYERALTGAHNPDETARTQPSAALARGRRQVEVVIRHPGRVSIAQAVALGDGEMHAPGGSSDRSHVADREQESLYHTDDLYMGGRAGGRAGGRGG